MNLLADGLTASELQHRGSSLKGDIDMYGSTEVSGIRARTGGAGLSKTEMLAEVIVPFPSPPLTEPQN